MVANRHGHTESYTPSCQLSQTCSNRTGSDCYRNLLAAETLNLLVELADERERGIGIHAMFTGEPINTTELRPALHTAARYRQARG
ncbi:hypothetical protein AB0E01_00740 [Nocardia vinacea]|uniref:hypothetical protein n=1 Tax=Nocardia vinacea TaxID=96468 RepID=UPI0033E68BA6